MQQCRKTKPCGIEKNSDKKDLKKMILSDRTSIEPDIFKMPVPVMTYLPASRNTTAWAEKNILKNIDKGFEQPVAKAEMMSTAIKPLTETQATSPDYGTMDHPSQQTATDMQTTTTALPTMENGETDPALLPNIDTPVKTAGASGEINWLLIGGLAVAVGYMLFNDNSGNKKKAGLSGVKNKKKTSSRKPASKRATTKKAKAPAKTKGTPAAKTSKKPGRMQVIDL